MESTIPGFPPTPVTMLRLVAAVKRLDLEYSFSNIDSADPRLIISHADGSRTTIQLEIEPRERGIMTLSLPGSVSFDRLPQLTRFVNDWNRDCISPTLVIDVSNMDAVTLWGRTTLEAAAGLSDSQLDTSIAHAMSTTAVLSNALAVEFPGLLTTDASIASRVRNAGPAHREDSFLPTASSLPREVTVERIRDALFSMGVGRVSEIPEIGVSTRINGMGFMFLLDNGPTFIAKGSWDTNLEPADFTRMFLVCNDFNRDSHLAAAFCHLNDDGLQVRMDATVPIAEGLNDEQLTAIVATTIRELLTGADHLAQQAGGVSPVTWPEED